MTVAVEIGLRELRASDLPQVLDLMRRALGAGSTPRTPNFWQWKHERSPFGASPGWVAVADGRVVALRVFIRWQWTTSAGAIDAVRAVDTATDPDWRRRGLFSDLTSLALEELPKLGCRFVFNTPNRRSGAGYRKLGWRSAPRPPLYVLAPRPISLARSAVTGSALIEPTDLGELPPVEALLAHPDSESLLCRADQRDLGLRTVRHRSYLRWRYAEVPGIDYRTLWAEDSNSHAVAIVRSRVRRSLREVVVSELWTGGSRGADLGRALIDRLTALEVDYLVAGAPRKSPTRDTLRACGFRTVPWGPTWMVRPLDDDPLPIDLTGSEWDLSAGDLEVF